MFEVTIDNFDGPLDLLLHLIKESKMDIMNLKLELIIDQYLKYINKMQELSLDIASSFLLMSVELIQIKTRKLLPKQEEDEIEEEDPEQRLIERLIEYQKYKDQVENFKSLEELRNRYYTKVPEKVSNYLEKDEKINLNGITLDDLVKAFQKFLERQNEEEERIEKKITRKELSLEDRMTEIKDKLRIYRKVNFFELFENKGRDHVIVSFLAILELAKKGELILKQDLNFDNIICEAANG